MRLNPNTRHASLMASSDVDIDVLEVSPLSDYDPTGDLISQKGFIKLFCRSQLPPTNRQLIVYYFHSKQVVDDFVEEVTL